jgi:hypothetical protein
MEHLIFLAIALNDAIAHTNPHTPQLAARCDLSSEVKMSEIGARKYS